MCAVLTNFEGALVALYTVLVATGQCRNSSTFLDSAQQNHSGLLL